MAVVKIKFNKDVGQTLRYVLSHGKEDDPRSGLCCSTDKEEVVRQFQDVREQYGVKSGNQCAHIVHSFSPEDSGKASLPEINQMGVELAQQYFPGHQILVVTHSDKEHVHNHIVVNTVSMTTGKRINNKFKHWHNLSRLNDAICLQHGLSIPNQSARERQSRMPDKVKRMERFNRFSFTLDMMQKADFARTYATSYDNYVAILSEFGIQARIEKENITYFYPGKDRGKRGRNMGKVYDKPYLERAFKANDEKFAKVPGIQVELRGKIASLKTADVAKANAPKDYSKYTAAPRRQAHHVRVAESALESSLAPVDEIHKARCTNIIDYCKREKIGLVTLGDGKLALKGREHVHIQEFEWMNTKNQTRGSLIDLVAAHKDVSFLQAIAHINGNPRLLLLEKHFGEKSRRFTSFYVPGGEAVERHVAQGRMDQWASFHGVKSDVGRSLLSHKLAQINKEGVIRLFARGDGDGTFEFSQDEQGKWTKQKRGEFKSPFLMTSGSNRTGVIYLDPFALIQHRGDELFAKKRDKTPVLALMEPNPAHVDLFVGQNTHLEHLEIVTTDPAKLSKVELDFFNNLKRRYELFRIQVVAVTRDQSARGHDIDLSFH